jgi:hypothetical protein
LTQHSSATSESFRLRRHEIVDACWATFFVAGFAFGGAQTILATAQSIIWSPAGAIFGFLTAICVSGLVAGGIGVLVGHVLASLVERRDLRKTPRRYEAALAIVAGVIASGSADAQQWTVDARPALEVAGAGARGGVLFGNANWATRLANGTIVIADASGPALHFIDATGKLIKSTGRAGQGPGDFRTVTWVAKCGAEGIVAWDFPQTRATSFDDAGTMRRTFPLGGRGGAQTSSSCNGKAQFVQMGGFRRVEPSTPPDPSLGYSFMQFFAAPQIVGTRSDTLATLAEVPVGEMVLGNMGGRGAGGMPRPIGAQTAFALAMDRLYVGIADSSLVAVFGLDGKRTGTINVQSSLRRATRVHYERAAEISLAMVPAPMREGARRWVLAIPMPEKLPPFTGLFVDPSGTLWVVLSAPGDANTQLRGFAADGRVVGNLTLPVNLNVFEVGADYVLGAREDADGEQYVTVYSFRRRTSP